MILDTRKPIHVAMGRLCLKAYSAREGALQNANIHPPSAPECILQLRQQSETTKVKRQARDAKSTKTEDAVCHSKPNIADINSMPNYIVASPDRTVDSAHFQHSTVSDMRNLTQTGSATDGDPFWFMSGFDDSQVNDYNGTMDVDVDSMLVNDQSMEDNNLHTIDWKQWDAWLANSNKLPPLSATLS
jgi:hypothetical protein